MDYIEQYVEMLRFKNRPFALVDGQLFIRKERWIVPLGPAAQAYRPDRDQCRELLRTLGGLWVMWTDGFDTPPPLSRWYAMICRQHKAIDDVRIGKRRKELRGALRDCHVRKVDAQEIAAHGYETYSAAIRSYGNQDVSEPDQFTRRVMLDQPFEDFLHQWAVYVEGRMVGFIQNLVYGNTEVDYALGRFHPEYRRFYPAYALFYRMNEYYLAQEGFQYANAGLRTISHETEIQEFLVRKFNFEKAYTGLHIHYRPGVGLLIRLARPFRSAMIAAYPRSAALFEMDSLRCGARYNR